MKVSRLIIHIPPLIVLACFIAFILWLNTGASWLFWRGANAILRDIVLPFSAPLRSLGFREGENGEFLSIGGRLIAILLDITTYYVIVYAVFRFSKKKF